MACIDVCKKDAIMIKDTFSEYNAVIDEHKCVNCGTGRYRIFFSVFKGTSCNEEKRCARTIY